LTDGLAAFGIAFVRDGAGIDEAQIGVLIGSGVLIADAGECLADEFGFVLVDLAAEGDGAEAGAGQRRVMRNEW
jgi:hypothetical protein